MPLWCRGACAPGLPGHTNRDHAAHAAVQPVGRAGGPPEPHGGGHAGEGSVSARQRAAAVSAGGGGGHSACRHCLGAASRGIDELAGSDGAGSPGGLGHAGEKRPQAGLHRHHLRHPAHHGRPAGPVQTAGAERAACEDGGLGGHPRRHAEPPARCHPLPVAHAAGHVAGPGLTGSGHACGLHPEHQRPGHHAQPEAQGQPRPQKMEGHEAGHPFRVLHPQPAAALLPGRARPQPRYRCAAESGATAQNGGRAERGQHRRFSGAGALQPACRVRRRGLHPCADQGAVGRPPLLRLRHQHRVHPAKPPHLCRAVPGHHQLIAAGQPAGGA